ncbi:MAG: hypothetical protein M3367_02930 [Acidobacteriota bacterium]|nr:hypothetical protein [Acidobacteriota bacterium]
MTIETTITTIETQNVLGANFQITTFEQTIAAFCDCCDAEATGAKTHLENQGWHLGSREQFCPTCN